MLCMCIYIHRYMFVYLFHMKSTMSAHQIFYFLPLIRSSPWKSYLWSGLGSWSLWQTLGRPGKAFKETGHGQHPGHLCRAGREQVKCYRSASCRGCWPTMCWINEWMKEQNGPADISLSNSFIKLHRAASVAAIPGGWRTSVHFSYVAPDTVQCALFRSCTFHSGRVWWGPGIRPLWKSYLSAAKQTHYLKNQTVYPLLSNVLMTQGNRLLKLKERQPAVKEGSTQCGAQNRDGEATEKWSSNPSSCVY